MYEPFPGNYVWNLSVNICIGMGGAIGEIDKANERVREIAKQGDDVGTEAFFSSWISMADRIAELADEAEAAGHYLSATEKYARATAYYVTAERMQSRHYEPRKQAYRTMLNTLQRMIVAGSLNCERVEIPYGENHFAALFVRGNGPGPRPCVVFCNGLDSVKEMIYLTARDEFAKRGFSCLMIDQPGVGEALRLGGLHAIAESEQWAAAAWIISKRARTSTVSALGSWAGHSADITLRALRHLKNASGCASRGAPTTIGANCNAAALRKRAIGRCLTIGIMSCGSSARTALESFVAYAPKMSLVGVVDKITVPFLITHGANDRQIPVADAHQSYNEAVNSPLRELKIFSQREGGIEHVSADNMEPARSYIADWIARGFQKCDVRSAVNRPDHPVAQRLRRDPKAKAARLTMNFLIQPRQGSSSS